MKIGNQYPYRTPYRTDPPCTVLRTVMAPPYHTPCSTVQYGTALVRAVPVLNIRENWSRSELRTGESSRAVSRPDPLTRLVRTVTPIPVVGTAAELKSRVDAIVGVLILAAVDVVLGAATVVVERVLRIVPVVTVVSSVVSMVPRNPPVNAESNML